VSGLDLQHYITVHIEAASVREVPHRLHEPNGRSSWRLASTRETAIYVSGTPDELRALAQRIEDAAYEYDRLNDDEPVSP
jgi:hypothetical protein